MRGWSAIVVVVLGCGRVGFDATTAADAPIDPDAPAAACAGYLICDDFEAPALNTSTWRLEETVTRTTAFSHRGSAAAAFRTSTIATNTSGAALLVNDTKLNAFAGPLWMRAWIRLAAYPAGTNAVELLGAQQPNNSPEDGLYVIVRAANTSVYSQFADVAAVTGAPPLDTWFCMIFRIERATAPTGRLDLTSDTIAAVSLTNEVTEGNPRVTHLRFGIAFASSSVNVTQPPFDMWIDDVIVHTAAVTCDD
jgi:hypothetical protein